MTRLQDQLRRFALASVVLGLIVGAAGQARAELITTLYNTGVDNSGTPLPSFTVGDPHYSLVSAPAGTAPIDVLRDGTGPPFPIFPLSGGPWLGNDSVSAWIGPVVTPIGASSIEGPVGAYDYQTTFDLTGFNLSTVEITGQWSADNEGTDILINGASTGNMTSGALPYENWTTFTISGGFVQGVNTLDFLVDNTPAGENPTGLRVEMTGTGSLVPEPSTVAMIATGLPLGLGFWCWNRRRAAATSTTTT